MLKLPPDVYKQNAYEQCAANLAKALALSAICILSRTQL